MKMTSSRLAPFVLIVCAAACGGGSAVPPPVSDAPARVTALADAYVKDYLAAFPYHALALGAPDVHPDQLADHSLPALARWEAREDALLADLGQIDAATLEGKPEANTYKFLQNQLQSARAFRVCRMELWNVSPTWTGWQGDFPLAAGQQATSTPADQKNALARWSQVPKYLDDEIANLKEGVRLGYTAPKHNVRTVVGMMDAMLKAPVSDSPFVQMAKPEMPEFRKQLEELETMSIRPAIARYRDYLRDSYLAGAREAIGVATNPDGPACYNAAVKLHSTVDMAPQAVHDLGKAQMARIRSEMVEIGRRSFGTPDPAKVLTAVKTDRKYLFKSRAELIAHAEAAVERARLAVPKWFGRVPKAPVIVEPYPAFLEQSAPGGQAVSPTPDGKPGKYMINAYDATAQSKAGLESTAFHEAYPGHHLQVALALEKPGLHDISRFFFLSGFGEGWALYSERLAYEMGLFSSDVDRLGLLSNEALRAGRLVVDSGMHALGWSRQEAIDYLLANTAEKESSVVSEIDRYIAVPGQATAYMIGNLEIRRIRTDAEQKLGPKFDIRVFHDLVLEDGSMPLWVLEEKVERWVTTRLAQK